jgi:hypothetical protein
VKVPPEFGELWFLINASGTSTQRHCKRWTGRSFNRRNVMAAILPKSIIPQSAGPIKCDVDSGGLRHAPFWREVYVPSPNILPSVLSCAARRCSLTTWPSPVSVVGMSPGSPRGGQFAPRSLAGGVL